MTDSNILKPVKSDMMTSSNKDDFHGANLFGKLYTLRPDRKFVSYQNIDEDEISGMEWHDNLIFDQFLGMITSGSVSSNKTVI